VPRPTLALCIPAYNEAQFLPRLFAGVRAQTVPFDEVLLYDDCSTDETGRVAAEFGATVVRGERNVGCSAGKNALAERTACDWVHFLDADDVHLPHFVERAHKWMSLSDGPDAVVFNYEYRDLLTDELFAVRNFDGSWLRRDPVAFTILQQINNVGIYRRDRFLTAGGFDTDPKVLYNEDVAMHTRLAQAGLRFDTETEISLVQYRRPGSMSAANRLKCVQAQYEVMRKAADRVGTTHGVEIADRLWRIAGCAAAELDWTTADAAVALAVRLAGRRVPSGGRLFSLLVRLSPSLAIRLRERLIRLFKPTLRAGLHS
jgi:glycosyltransferase involved in cell wall biosynthesis